MSDYTLAQHGDPVERHYESLFISREFPSYQRFWQRFVVPLTNRPIDIRFKTPDDLRAIGKGDREICIAQLHYSILRHLARAFDLRVHHQIDLDQLTDGMVRLTGAQDIAFELLQRFGSPQSYDPWLAVGSGKAKGSKEARQSWQKEHSYPLQDIRDYRNHLVHGRILPSVIGPSVLVPRITKENDYFDWRRITHHSNIQAVIGSDLIEASQVLNQAWRSTVDYLEVQWTKFLLNGEVSPT